MESAEDKRIQRARDILEARLSMRDPFRGPMMERGREEILGPPGPELAASFVEEFRASEGERRLAALFLAIEAGGSDAAAFMGKIVNGEAEGLSAEERLLVLRSLPGIPSAGGLPVDSATVDAAYRLSASSEPDERKGAAGILATQDDAQARVVLMNLADRDADSWVRAAAIRALGRAGDRSTLTYLEAYPREDFAQEYWVQGALEDAIAQLARRLGDGSPQEE